MKDRKIVLVGTGFVGMSMAYSFLTTGGRRKHVALFEQSFKVRDIVECGLPFRYDVKLIVTRHKKQQHRYESIYFFHYRLFLEVKE